MKEQSPLALTLKGTEPRSLWDDAGIALPAYDVRQSAEKARRAPRWVHFGVGNIFRVFIAGIADALLRAGTLDRGVTCVETYDAEIVRRVYDPFDNLILSVILNRDGTKELRVLGSAAEAVVADFRDEASLRRMKEIFTSRELQIVSFTVTEKGYAVRDPDGAYLAQVARDIENGPERAVSVPAIVAAMLLARFSAGRLPVALVSMDNCARNGDHLRDAVLAVAREWQKHGFVGDDFLAYLSDPSATAFPCTMIDKITPRPAQAVADALTALGVISRPLSTRKSRSIS